MHDDEVIAVAEGDKLFRQDVVALLPGGLSPQDSAAAADRIIQEWALEKVIARRIEQDLPSEEKDISREIEEYRNSLLRFRFEQSYIRSHLDTVVTEEQIQEYYGHHSSLSKLGAPILKARVFRIPPKSRERDEIRRMLKEGGEDDIAELRALGQRPACSYTDFDGRWVSAPDMVRRYGFDLSTQLSAAAAGTFITLKDEQSEEVIIYLIDVVDEGKAAPVEYCRELMKESILSERKRSLTGSLSQDLLKEAAAKGEYEVYESKN